MKRLIAILALASMSAWGQNPPVPPLVNGQVLTAAQWNAIFAQYLNYSPSGNYPWLTAAVLTVPFASPPPIGTVTPNSAIFTTLDATGITTTAGNSGIAVQDTSATTGYIDGLDIANTSGAIAIELEGAAGAVYMPQDSPYDGVIEGLSGLAFSGDGGTSMGMRLSSAGLTVGNGHTHWLTLAGSSTNPVIGVSGGGLNILPATVNIGSASGSAYLVATSTTNQTTLAVNGGTNSILIFSSLGTGQINFATENAATTQFEITDTASAVNYVKVTGATTGHAPVISTNAGNLSINPNGGTTAVTGTMTISALTGASESDIVCYNTTGGVLSYATSVAGCVPSALRYKNLLGIIDDSFALSSLMGLTPRLYQYKNSKKFGKQKYNGLIADEVCKIDENLCIRDKKGRVENYDKVGMLAYVIAAMKAQQKEIEGLKAELRDTGGGIAYPKNGIHPL